MSSGVSDLLKTQYVFDHNSPAIHGEDASRYSRFQKVYRGMVFARVAADVYRGNCKGLSYENPAC